MSKNFDVIVLCLRLNKKKKTKMIKKPEIVQQKCLIM